MSRKMKEMDFIPMGLAIKHARMAKGLSRNAVANITGLSPRYIASIENSGQCPSLQIFYNLVTLLDISVDELFYTDKEVDASTNRRQLDTLIDGMSDKGLQILTATANGICDAEKGEE